LLCDAIRQAAATVDITADLGNGQLPVRLGFGTQTDARPIRHDPALPGTGGKLSVQAVAN